MSSYFNNPVRSVVPQILDNQIWESILSFPSVVYLIHFVVVDVCNYLSLRNRFVLKKKRGVLDGSTGQEYARTWHLY